MSALILSETDTFRLRLASRAGLPSFIEVEVARSVAPFFPCGTYDVAALDEYGNELHRAPVVLGKWTSPLDNLLGHYECFGYATLHLSGYTGQVAFALYPQGGNDPYLASLPFDLLGIRGGAALDEQRGFLDSLGELQGLVKWTVLGTVVVGGAYLFGPLAKKWADSLEEVE